VSIWKEGVGPGQSKSLRGSRAYLWLTLPSTFPYAYPEDDVHIVASAALMGFLKTGFRTCPRGFMGDADAAFGLVHPVKIKSSFSLGVQPGDGAALQCPVATLPVESFNADSPLWQWVSPSLLSPSVQIGLLYPCGISVLLVLAGSLTGG
jgi:hypothetical protein